MQRKLLKRLHWYVHEPLHPSGVERLFVACCLEEGGGLPQVREESHRV
jgi:hypothetical protein